MRKRHIPYTLFYIQNRPQPIYAATKLHIFILPQLLFKLPFRETNNFIREFLSCVFHVIYITFYIYLFYSTIANDFEPQSLSASWNLCVLSRLRPTL